jgi:hypothetical protein
MHEAGYAVVAEAVGLTVNEVRLMNVFVGVTDLADQRPVPHEALVKVALAGFAAVGSLLGDEAERQNRETDAHYEEGSDLLTVIEQRSKQE